MRNGRKVLAVLLVVVMVLSLAGCTPGGKIETAPPESNETDSTNTLSTVSTEPSDEPQSASWEYKDGVLTISGEGTVGNYVDGIAPWEEHKAEITSIVIGEGITRVEKYAFAGLENVAVVSGGENVTYVAGTAFEDTWWYEGKASRVLGSCFVKYPEGYGSLPDDYLDGYSFICAYAFAGTNITQITIPANTYISPEAFAGCEDLYSINISSDTGEDDAVAISTNAFNRSYWYSNQLDSVQYTDGYIFLGNNLVRYVGESDHIAIPAGTTSIGGNAFVQNPKLLSVTIPVSVKKISVAAFNNSPLEDIYYEGSEDEWNAIEFFEDNNPFGAHRSPPTIHYNSSMPE